MEVVAIAAMNKTSTTAEEPEKRATHDAVVLVEPSNKISRSVAFVLAAEPLHAKEPSPKPNRTRGGDHNIRGGHDEKLHELKTRRLPDNNVGNRGDEGEQTADVREQSLDEQEAKELTLPPKLAAAIPR